MTFTDQLIGNVDRALRTLTGTLSSVRASPGAEIQEADMDATSLEHAAALMRVNHTGEICAQALYDGQSLTARDDETRRVLKTAAQEEGDHLVWCKERLDELGGRPSLLNPAFYVLSFGMGAAAGLLGDRVSLGFVEATEEQVGEHLSGHLHELPERDRKSRAILLKMREDEASHGASAKAASARVASARVASGNAAGAKAEGAGGLPKPIKLVMTALSKVMTKSTYRI